MKEKWEKKSERQRFLEGVAERYGIEETEDWQRVGKEDIMAFDGGSTLLQRYQHSVRRLLEDSIDDLDGRVRPRAGPAYWKKDKIVRKFLEKLREDLCISKASDWARVSVEQVRQSGGGGLLHAMSLKEALQMAYPSERWTTDAIRAIDEAPSGKRAAQRQLLNHVAVFFSRQPSAVLQTTEGRREGGRQRQREI